jgi:V-type H+-transporting ATPase subunit d
MSYGRDISLGNMSTFNMLHGFVEALVRGYRSGFLTDTDYHHLTQCDALEDVKMNLQETDYDTFLNAEATITPAIIENRALKKLVNEFFYFRANAVEPLAQFMDYITYEYMIENVMLLLRGTLSGRNVNDLISQCHPLGMFKESTMRNIPSFEANPRGYADLYETVLVDTPVGPYFQTYLEQSSASISAASEVRNVLEEVQIEILKNSLMKLYLEDFYAFCEKLGGETAEVMCGLLRARADRAAINITLNSFGTPLNDATMRDTERKKLYPSIGELYPAGTELLSKADDDVKLGQAVSSFPQYHAIFEKFLNSSPEEFSIDDEFYKREVRMYEMAFESQMHFGCIYGYVKLKEQEIRNLVWISECILQRRKDQISNFIPVFSPSSEWRAESTRRGGTAH